MNEERIEELAPSLAEALKEIKLIGIRQMATLGFLSLLLDNGLQLGQALSIVQEATTRQLAAEGLELHFRRVLLPEFIPSGDVQFNRVVISTMFSNLFNHVDWHEITDQMMERLGNRSTD